MHPTFPPPLSPSPSCSSLRPSLPPSHAFLEQDPHFSWDELTSNSPRLRCSSGLRLGTMFGTDVRPTLKAQRGRCAFLWTLWAVLHHVTAHVAPQCRDACVRCFYDTADGVTSCLGTDCMGMTHEFYGRSGLIRHSELSVPSFFVCHG